MALFEKIFGKYLPENSAEKAQVGRTVARLKGVHELLADAVEAVEELELAGRRASRPGPY